GRSSTVWSPRPMPRTTPRTWRTIATGSAWRSTPGARTASPRRTWPSPARSDARRPATDDHRSRCAHELMDALVRHAKKIRGVPDTQVEPTSQQPSSIARGLLRDRVLARRALPRGGRCIDHPAGFRWEPDLIDELHGISVVAIETQR